MAITYTFHITMFWMLANEIAHDYWHCTWVKLHMFNVYIWQMLCCYLIIQLIVRNYNYIKLQKKKTLKFPFLIAWWHEIRFANCILNRHHFQNYINFPFDCIAFPCTLNCSICQMKLTECLFLFTTTKLFSTNKHLQFEWIYSKSSTFYQKIELNNLIFLSLCSNSLQKV